MVIASSNHQKGGKIMRRLILSSTLLLGLIFLNSCLSGYTTGNLGHPQISSVAIAPVRNLTTRPELRVSLQQRLQASVQNDGAYKLKPQSSADCTLYTVIKSFKTDGVGSSYRSDKKEGGNYKNYGTAIYRFTMEVEYTVLLPDQERPLVTLSTISGSSRFTEAGDIEVARQSAARNAATDAANQIIASITEAW